MLYNFIRRYSGKSFSINLNRKYRITTLRDERVPLSVGKVGFMQLRRFNEGPPSESLSTERVGSLLNN